MDGKKKAIVTGDLVASEETTVFESSDEVGQNEAGSEAKEESVEKTQGDTE